MTVNTAIPFSVTLTDETNRTLHLGRECIRLYDLLCDHKFFRDAFIQVSKMTVFRTGL
jgi:hypothetical protein